MGCKNMLSRHIYIQAIFSYKIGNELIRSRIIRDLRIINIFDKIFRAITGVGRITNLIHNPVVTPYTLGLQLKRAIVGHKFFPFLVKIFLTTDPDTFRRIHWMQEPNPGIYSVYGIAGFPKNQKIYGNGERVMIAHDNKTVPSNIHKKSTLVIEDFSAHRYKRLSRLRLSNKENPQKINRKIIHIIR